MLSRWTHLKNSTTLYYDSRDYILYLKDITYYIPTRIIFHYHGDY